MKIRWLLLILLVMLGLPAKAQDENPALLALRTASTDLQTGEFYTIRIEVDNITELWAATMRIAYDPQQLFIVGTNSGSPVELGDFLSGGGLVIQNTVVDDEGFMRFTPSRIAPADPVSGSGVIGEFLIFPLQSGTATLSFLDAQLSQVIYTTNVDGVRTVQDSVLIPFVVTQLTLNITGDMVTPPPEATATPTVSPSPFPTEGGDDIPTETPIPTLVVVEDISATPVIVDTVEAGTNNSVLVLIAAGVAIIAVIVLLGMFITLRRQSTPKQK